jgi:hypothetical protein
MDDLIALIRSLDRCPHGRHIGETCAGYRGPGIYDGGCLGGRSLGNPHLQTAAPGRIGTDVHGFPITINDISAVVSGWHWVQYAVKMGSGDIRTLRDDNNFGPVPATLEEAKRHALECGDPLARVVIVRVCPWVNAQSAIPLPDPEFYMECPDCDDGITGDGARCKTCLALGILQRPPMVQTHGHG